MVLPSPETKHNRIHIKGLLTDHVSFNESFIKLTYLFTCEVICRRSWTVHVIFMNY